MDIQKLKRNIKLDRTIIQRVFVNNRENKSYFISSLNKVISKQDYDGITSKYDINEDVWDLYRNQPKWGVWQKIRGDWKWSYINTIETNYSAIFELVNFYNDLIKKGRLNYKEVTYAGLTESFRTECDQIISFIDKYFDRVFGLYEVTELSNKLSVATSYSWYNSMLSEMSYVRMVIKDTKMIPIYGKERGDGEDYNSGVDFSIIDNGIDIQYQHKRCNDSSHHPIRVVLDDENDCVIIPTSVSKRKHRDVDYLVVENNGTIYEFNIQGIETDESIEVTNSTTTIPNDRLTNVFEKNDDDQLKLLMDIFRRCNLIGYTFNIFDSVEPYVDLNVKNKQITIGFGGVDIESVEEDLRKSLDILLNTFN